VKTTKYLLKTENGIFLGSPTNTLTDNIQMAAVFNPYQNPPHETAARYGVRFGKMTPMELIPLSGGIFPKYELKEIGQNLDQKPTFQARDYIITRDGYRGIVIRQLDRGDMYEIKTAGGYTIRDANDLKLDELMLEEAAA
jgi:hypothetical protein